ncbi:MAG: P-type conjugative transfer protein TrbL [Betaproteobacteria bacterium]|nr:P-type conjugative transfer protein TrbL [Betaproteobacteria bacterium]
MKTLHKAALTGAVLLFYSAGAAAQLSNQGLFDQVVTEFATRATSWQSVVMNAAMWVFWTLGTISLAWTGGMMILRKADIGEFFAEFVRFIIFFGFFLWLLRNGPAFASSIIQSLQRLGEQASGVSSVTPSGIVDIGFMIFKQSLVNMSLWSPIDSVIGFVLSLGILLLLATIGVNMLLLFVSSWILMYAGVFFLGFGGSRWTSDMAVNYYKTVLGVAVQIFAMVLLVGIGVDLLSSFYAKMNKGTLNFEELGVMLVFCMALLMLINKVPGLLSGVITGAGIGHAGIGNFGAGAVAGAALGAAGMAATAAGMAGAAVMGGAQNIAGGMSAIKAAFEKAAGMDGGSGQMPSFGGGSDSGGASSGSGSGNSSGSTPFAQAAGFASSSGSSGGSSSNSAKVGKAEGGNAKGKDSAGADQAKTNQGQAKSGSESKAQGASSAGGLARAAAVTASAAGELAKGAGSVLKGKAVQLAEGFQERMSQTAGGQVAAAIRASMLTQDAPAFEGNSLAGKADDEVAAFVNRSREDESDTGSGTVQREPSGPMTNPKSAFDY